MQIPEFETIRYDESDDCVAIAMGTNQESIAEGQQLFASGKRFDWKLR